MDDPTQLLPKKLAHARPLFDPQIIGRATAESFRSTMRVDVLLSLLASAKTLKDGARVHFHAYTAETIEIGRAHV